MNRSLDLIFLFLLFGCTSLQSQIVNIESKRSERKDTAGFFGQIELGLNLVDNGQKITRINSGLQMELLKNEHVFLSFSNFNFISAGEENFINNGFQHFRYNYNINETITYELFTQIQYDEKVRIELRFLTGTGARFRLIQKEKNVFFLGLAYMFEYNQLSDTSIIYRDQRLNTYFSFELKPASNMTISGTTYYQPLFSDLLDARISSKTSVNFLISKRLIFDLSFILVYDARLERDAPGVPGTTYSFTNGIRFNF